MNVGKVKQKGKAGVMIVGHKEYWPQFPGEREDIITSGEIFEELLERCVVACIVEDRLPCVASLNDVIQPAWDVQSGSA